MRRKLALLGAMCGLVATFSALNVLPADAHWDGNSWSYATCGNTEPPVHRVTHAHVVNMGVYSNGVAWVQSACQSYPAFGGGGPCGWIGIAESWAGVVRYRIWSGPTGNC